MVLIIRPFIIQCLFFLRRIDLSPLSKLSIKSFLDICNVFFLKMFWNVNTSRLRDYPATKYVLLPSCQRNNLVSTKRRWELTPTTPYPDFFWIGRDFFVDISFRGTSTAPPPPNKKK